MPAAPRSARAGVRLPLVIAMILGALSCTHKTRETKARALTNLERIAAWERGRRGFRRMPPRPAGSPWNHPVAAADVNWSTSQEELHLEPDGDGQFRGQYEVRLDPMGELVTVLAKISPYTNNVTPEAQERVPMWCEILARGKFRSTPDVVELFLRVQRSLQNETSQTEVAERPVAP
jgi:hypothetical protein